MYGWFKIVKSIWGDYWQVRVRTPSGEEDTVDRCYSMDEAQALWDKMQEQFTPLEPRPS